jgi:hypothetical protein
VALDKSEGVVKTNFSCRCFSHRAFMLLAAPLQRFKKARDLGHPATSPSSRLHCYTASMADINAYLETCACCRKPRKCNAESQCYECQEEVRWAQAQCSAKTILIKQLGVSPELLSGHEN